MLRYKKTMTFQAWSRRLIVDREPARDDSVAKRVNIWVCSEGQLVYTVINLNSAHLPQSGFSPATPQYTGLYVMTTLERRVAPEPGIFPLRVVGSKEIAFITFLRFSLIHDLSTGPVEILLKAMALGGRRLLSEYRLTV